MQITELKTYVMHDGWRNLIFVALHTDAGLVGHGEATLANRTEAVLAYLEGIAARHVVGSDPFDIEALWNRLYRGDFIRGGMIACAGLSAIDIACHDLMGQALGVPVYKLLGGAYREAVPCYANGWYTVGRDPEKIAARAQDVQARGYRAAKIDPFGGGSYTLSRQEFALSVAIVKALRAAVGDDFEIYIEGHGRFAPRQAIDLCRALEPYRIGWFEEPCPWDDPLAWREVKDKVDVPIAGGEHFCTRYGFRQVIESRCVDILQPDVLYVGGLTEMRKLCAWADAYSIMVAPHNSQGPVCTAASAHFALTCPNLLVQEVFDDFMPPHVKEAVPGHPNVIESEIPRAALDSRPGLGVQLNREVIGQHPFQTTFFNLFAEGWERRFAREEKSG
ncbi:MAG TPA: mandelate racemase/muconate lactonizing enzyme family protein [Chthonomonadaceae bacterium]|nr:mandelate racemase/muconate lactonizing enzyme family protein [Chthonomonadaceae bacterium]